MPVKDIDPEQLKPALADYIFDHARKLPERTAMSSEYGDISYADLASNVRRLGVALQRSGVRPGDRVAVLTTPRADGYSVFLALNAIGAIWLGINPVYQYREMRYVVDDAAPVALIFLSGFQGREYLEDARRLMDDCPSLRQAWCLDRSLPGVESLQEVTQRLVPRHLIELQGTEDHRGSAGHAFAARRKTGPDAAEKTASDAVLAAG
jgi:acyl-coenzyme A synthetase/AMP-(fatty) acid ligase